MAARNTGPRAGYGLPDYHYHNPKGQNADDYGNGCRRDAAALASHLGELGAQSAQTGVPVVKPSWAMGGSTEAVTTGHTAYGFLPGV